jgi:hypothetical protein
VTEGREPGGGAFEDVVAFLDAFESRCGAPEDFDAPKAQQVNNDLVAKIHKL